MFAFAVMLYMLVGAVVALWLHLDFVRRGGFSGFANGLTWVGRASYLAAAWTFCMLAWPVAIYITWTLRNGSSPRWLDRLYDADIRYHTRSYYRKNPYAHPSYEDEVEISEDPNHPNIP